MFIKSDVRNQFYATFCVNILTIAYGCALGWPSPNVPILQSDETPLPTGKLTVGEASWVSSLICIGGFPGIWAFRWATDRYGRKWPLLLCALPLIICWLLIIFANNVIYIYIARFLSGFCGGGVMILVPMFVTEIATDRVRGNLGAILIFFGNFGILLIFTFGYYLSYMTTQYVILTLPIIFVCSFIYFPETPQFLIRQGKEYESEKSLCFYSNLNPNQFPDINDIQSEMKKLRTLVFSENMKNGKTSVSISDFRSKAARKGLLIGVILIIFYQFSGCFAMLNYSATIFAESGSTLHPNASAIIIAFIQIAGSLLAIILVDRAGRKILLEISLIGTSIGQLVMAAYFHMKLCNVNIESLTWLPVTAYSFIILIASCGILSLPFIIVSEILPERIRSFGSSICMSSLFMSAFVLIKFFPIVSNLFGMHICMYFFAFATFLGGLFVLFVLPETKGKSLDEITNILMR